MMWKFLRKIIVSIALVICIFLCVNYVWYKYLNRTRIVAFEVYDAVSLVSQKTDYTALVLGDSVARQIFNPEYQSESETTAYLATNQAVTPAGNYMLLRKFHDNNPQLKEVYYIARPDNYFSSVNFLYTYSYFITPLYNDSFTQYLSDETCTALEQTFGRLFTGKEFSKWMLAKYPKLLEIYQDNRHRALGRIVAKGDPAPDLAVPYLQEMQRYCTENDIELHLLFSPVPENFELDTDKFLFLKEYGDSVQYQALMNSLIYIEEENLGDRIHMKKEYMAEHREDIKDALVTVQYGY